MEDRNHRIDLHGTMSSSNRMWTIKWRRLFVKGLAVLVFGIITTIVVNDYVLAPRFGNQSSKILTAQKQLVEIRLGIVGTVEPATAINVVAPIEGVVSDKQFKFGGNVEEGQLLLRLNTSDAQAKEYDATAAVLKASRALHEMENWKTGPDVSRARRAVLSSQIALEQARQRSIETGVLLERGLVPKIEYDYVIQQLKTLELQHTAAQEDLAGTLNKGSKDNLEIAKLEFFTANRRLQDLQKAISQKEIISPVAGIVLESSSPPNTPTSRIPIEVGSNVAKGQVLFRVADTKRVVITAKVDEIDVNRLRSGQLVDVSMDALPGKTIRGYLTEIAAQGEANFSSLSKTATFAITVSVPEISEAERPSIRMGMSARLSIIEYQQDSIVLPINAVKERDGRPTVEVIDSSLGKVVFREVIVGRPTGTGIEILRGINVGDRIRIN